MSDRRYTESEVADIFARAAEGPETPSLPGKRDDGLTLAALQDIGREVDISPESVARAARSVDINARSAPETLLGLPIGVGRTVSLDRRLTDAEWEHLVVELREVFGARGTVSASGSLRQWTNGNLQALLEPTASGHRLRLRTVNGSSRAQMSAGLATIGIAAVVSIAAAAGVHFSQALPGILLIAAAGAAMFASGALRLPAWARLRQRQMEGIAAGLALPADPQSPKVPHGPVDPVI